MLQLLVKVYSMLCEYQRAIEYAHRWLAIEPWNETAHRELMKLYAWSKNQSCRLARISPVCPENSAEFKQ